MAGSFITETARLSVLLVSSAALTDIGMDTRPRRSFLGIDDSVSDARVHWRQFLTWLLPSGTHVASLFPNEGPA